jgi:hypothetical protein
VGKGGDKPEDLDTVDFLSLSIYIYREREGEREFGYGVVRSTDDLCATNRFSIFKVQIVDLTGQNIFYMKI